MKNSKILLRALLISGFVLFQQINAQSPGGLSSNLQLWLKANSGTNTTTDGADVSSWTDASPNAHGLVTLTAAPDYVSNSVNFNPAIDFDFTSSESLKLTGGLVGNGNTWDHAYVYVVTTIRSLQSSHFFIERGAVHTTRFGLDLPWSDNNVYWDVGNILSGSGRLTLNYTSMGASLNTVGMFSFGASISAGTPAGAGKAMYYQGAESISDHLQESFTGIGNDFEIGNQGTSYMDAVVSEIIVYNGVPSQTELDRIHSYLAIKYGITALVGTGLVNYLASDGSSFWNGLSAGPAYQNNIFGIGRDDGSGLDQRVSKSQNSGAILTLALDNDFTSANNDASRTTAFSSDRNFLMLGNNGGTVTDNLSSTELPANHFRRIDREWYVQNTGSVGAVHLKFDGFNSDYKLFSDADGDFSSGATEVGTLSATGTISTTLTHASYITLVKTPSLNTYTGGSPGDWDTPSNWSSGVPTLASDVQIPAGKEVTKTGDLTVEVLNIGSGGHLTVNGNFTNNGASTVNSPGSIIITGTSSGDLTYNRGLTTNWHLISSPVVGQDVDAFASTVGLAVGTGNNRGLASYNNTVPEWSYYQNGATGTGNFPQGEGRSIKLAALGNIAFKGTMPVTDVGVPISSNSNGFNLIGNPYPSAIPANINADGTNNILTVNSASLTEQTIWFWHQGGGFYQQINQASASRFIEPTEGFFVSSNGSNTFNFTEAMQSHQSFQRNGNTRPEIKLSITDGNTIRETDIFYITGTTTGWDNGYDSSLFGPGDHSFAIFTQLVSDNTGNDLGIQSLPDSNYETMIIPVGVNASAATQITISANSINLPTGIQVYLEDKNDDTFTLLDATSDFTTTLSADQNGIGRFYLHTTSQTLNLDNFTLENVSVFSSAKNNLRIVGIHSGEATIHVHNILGKEVLRATFKGNGVNDISTTNVSKGVHIIQIETATGKLNKKVIIE